MGVPYLETSPVAISGSIRLKCAIKCAKCAKCAKRAQMGGAPFVVRVYRNAIAAFVGTALLGVTKDAAALQRVQEIINAHPSHEAASKAINSAIWDRDPRMKVLTDLMTVPSDPSSGVKISLHCSADVEIYDKEYTDS